MTDVDTLTTKERYLERLSGKIACEHKEDTRFQYQDTERQQCKKLLMETGLGHQRKRSGRHATRTIPYPVFPGQSTHARKASQLHADTKAVLTIIQATAGSTTTVPWSGSTVQQRKVIKLADSRSRLGMQPSIRVVHHEFNEAYEVQPFFDAERHRISKS